MLALVLACIGAHEGELGEVDKAAKLLQVHHPRSYAGGGACENDRPVCDFVLPLLLLLWRTGEFPRSKGLIAIPNISLTRDVMDFSTLQVMATRCDIDVGPLLQRLTGCRCSR